MFIILYYCKIICNNLYMVSVNFHNSLDIYIGTPTDHIHFVFLQVPMSIIIILDRML